MEAIERIGFIGLGTMGRPMAGHLVDAGYEVHVADADPKAVSAFLGDKRAEAPQRLAELGRASRIVVTMLAHDAVVRQVLFGEPEGEGDAVIEGLAPGSIVIDMSSSAPMGTRRTGAALAKLGVAMVDAPVSGGNAGARKGTLTIMAGGDDADIDRCMPLFEAMGERIFRTGGLGNGHAIKVLGNCVAAVGLVAAVEGMLVCKRFGVSPATTLAVFNQSSGFNSATRTTIPEQVIPRTFAAGFLMGHMAKDVRFAVELADTLGIDVPVAHECLRFWTRALESRGPSADWTSAVQVLEEEVGERLEERSD